MPGHDDTVPFREQQVAPPADRVWGVDGAGLLVFTGTCPVCHARNTVPFPTIAPGAVRKRWRRRGSAPLVRTVDCRCPVAHPDNEDEVSGCGAWWDVELPPVVAP